MTQHEELARMWELIEEIGTCMLITRDEDGIRARPMAAHFDRDNNAILFLTNRAHHKVEEVQADNIVCLAFSDADRHYVSVTGRATVSQDQKTIEALWSPEEKAWFEDKNDPDIAVLSVTPDHAEYWDRPSTPAAVIKMKAAAVTGAQPDMGANAKMEM